MLSQTTPLKTIKIVAGVIIDHEGRYLLVRKAGTQAFMQPGGKSETGEDPIETLVREIAEELGCEINRKTVEYLGCFIADAANEPGLSISIKN